MIYNNSPLDIAMLLSPRPGLRRSQADNKALKRFMIYSHVIAIHKF